MTDDTPLRLVPGATPLAPVRVEDWRCADCKTLLARMHLTAGSSVSVKCRRCGAVNTLRAC